MVAAVAFAEALFPLSSRNIPLPFWQHCGSLLQQRLPSLHGVTRGNTPVVSSKGT